LCGETLTIALCLITIPPMRTPLALIAAGALVLGLTAGPAHAAGPPRRPATASKTTPKPTAINDLARTPYLGWNTYYGLGSTFDENTIKSVADAIVSRGLKVTPRAPSPWIRNSGRTA
jgi:hypothetical protein